MTKQNKNIGTAKKVAATAVIVPALAFGGQDGTSKWELFNKYVLNTSANGVSHYNQLILTSPVGKFGFELPAIGNDAYTVGGDFKIGDHDVRINGGNDGNENKIKGSAKFNIKNFYIATSGGLSDNNYLAHLNLGLLDTNNGIGANINVSKQGQKGKDVDPELRFSASKELGPTFLGLGKGTGRSYFGIFGIPSKGGFGLRGMAILNYDSKTKVYTLELAPFGANMSKIGYHYLARDLVAYNAEGNFLGDITRYISSPLDQKGELAFKAQRTELPGGVNIDSIEAAFNPGMKGNLVGLGVTYNEKTKRYDLTTGAGAMLGPVQIRINTTYKPLEKAVNALIRAEFNKPL